MEAAANWIAPIATTIAAIMVAANLGARLTGYGFIVFSVGAITLPVERDRLEALPGFDKDAWPTDADPAFADVA